MAINSHGAIVGYGDDPNDRLIKGFLYSGGNYTYIFPGNDALPYDINDDGAIVGEAYDDADGTWKGFFYSGGNYTEIIPPNWLLARAVAINAGGTIVGYGMDANGDDKGFIATLESVCSTWTDVMNKYNTYVSGQASWSNVISCYNEYVSP